eukprot:GFUD01028943.1.p1 GENE.GFUD01028943.1~~GFUD01028943.1.p1  ORF type:complete len:343 (+),score=114.89 GFUD01028943.1:158-1186(+)
MQTHDSDEEQEEEQPTKERNGMQVQTEINLLPPLLPLKFGNGLLLQYTVNHPGVDDKLYLLEIGLVTGMTSLALVLLTTMVNYLLKSANSVWQFKKEKVEHLAGLANQLNRLVGVVQALLLIVLFIYTVSLYPKVEFDDETSPFFVKKRIYMFSLVVSFIMFISALVAATLMLVLTTHHPLPPSSPHPVSPVLPHPAYSILPLGLANALLGLYIGIPGDDHTIVGPRVFLLDLCLFIGTVTVFMTVLESVIKVALSFALRDGHLDMKETSLLKYLHLARYFMALLQVVMFTTMFCHTLEIFIAGDRPDYTCPRNLLMISMVLSSIILMAGVTAILVGAYLKF